ncbi:NADH dehydrogenase ubiquinone 1 alpha subcomplex subunit 13 [Taenia crassiceps]|uniref:NADH dehydrogenase [ubiquinone] 1 alpha subcomplex subunit 13 n=1 Tax=Taenia crassiceps TaxID=6207 RepID=A0ABR4QJY3_9CEST
MVYAHVLTPLIGVEFRVWALMVAYKQEMPPPGGFATFNVFNKAVRKHLNGLYLIGALYACTFVGIKLRLWGKERKEARDNENREQRMYLRQLVKNRDYETELMKDVPGWEVGHWYDTPVYHNPRGLWCEPNQYEYYAHLSRKDAGRQRAVHFEY